MKKCINLLLFLVMAVTLASCGGDSALKMQIESGKKHCPMNLGMAGKLTSMNYDEKDKVVEFVISLNKQLANVDDLKKDPSSAKEAMRLALSKGDMNKLLKMMVDAEASLKVTYKNRGSKDELTLDFPASELKDIYDNPMDESAVNKMMLDNQVKSERNRLPYSIDRGLKVTDIQDNGTNLVYICEVDEDLYEIDNMAEGKDELKKNMEDMLKDRAMRKQAEILASLNKGFQYNYVGKPSGKTIVVEFSAAELGEIAGKTAK
ncbi:MAG: hypothetical protein HDS03_08510 [Bacteroides sp.]|nr:hypothetical protein [Bacteroides sp.]